MARKTVRPGKKRRSAAQRAATARMLAANRARRGGSAKSSSPRRKNRKHRARSSAVSRTVSRVYSKARRRVSRARRTYSRAPASVKGAVQMLTDAAVMGAGAVGVDIVMGQVAKFLPTGWNTPVDATGVNYKYVAAKVGVALGVGMLGSRFLGGKLGGMAMKAAQGSLVVQTAALLESMVPTGSVPLGFASTSGTRPAMGAVNTLPSNVQMLGRTSSLGAPPVYQQGKYRSPMG